MASLLPAVLIGLVIAGPIALIILGEVSID